MPRYAPKMSVNDLKFKLLSYAEKNFDAEELGEDDFEDSDDVITYGMMDQQFTKVYDDVKKIRFDYENVYVEKYLELSSGIPIALVLAGGDWELPLLFALYYDGSTFRGYIPTEGNVFNRTLKQAYGNATDEEDEADCLKHFGVKNSYDLKLDYDKAIADIGSRIKVRKND